MLAVRAALPVRRLIRKGYQPIRQPPPPTDCLIGRPGGRGGPAGLPATAVAAALGGDLSGGIGLVLPTYVARASLASNADTVRELLDQLAGLEDGRPVVLFVGMQWRGDEKAEAVERLEHLRELVQAAPGITFVGVAMPQAGKSRMLNAAFGVATGLGLAGVAWVDDDVRFGPGCISLVVRAFLERGARGSVGARKVPEPTEFTAARVMHRGKLVTKTPKFSYPHGCCMIVDAEQVARGIPDRYTCEDDYFCFALLDPAHENPLHNTHIVAEAVCYHVTGGPAGEVRKRVTRSLLTAAVLMSDFPDDVVAAYVLMYFHGLWPLAAVARGNGFRFAVQKWLLKGVHFVWFSQVALGVAARGLIGRPLQEIPWSAYSRHEKPTGLPPESAPSNAAQGSVAA